MNNQEMQFADPDWKPSQQLDTKTDPEEREGYNPQPINTDYREQNQWRTAAPSPPQQEGYTGLRPYAPPPPQQMQGVNFRQYRRRGRGPWFWIILAFIIISLASGGFRSFNGPSSNFDRSAFPEKQIVGKPIDFRVTGRPTIMINDPNGTVTVTQGQSNSDVIVQAVNRNNFFGNSNNIPVNISQDANNPNVINAIVQDGQSSVDVNVTVPQGADLQLQTDSGDINVTGVDGQMTLKTNSGDITASNDVMSGSSVLTTDGGGINFGGDVAKGGTYRFTTTSGDVDLSVSNNSAFHIEASTNSGSIDIPGVTPSSSGTKASGDVGTSSQIQGTQVTVTTDSGSITVNQR